MEIVIVVLIRLQISNFRIEFLLFCLLGPLDKWPVCMYTEQAKQNYIKDLSKQMYMPGYKEYTGHTDQHMS